jgi:hypothetical protein
MNLKQIIKRLPKVKVLRKPSRSITQRVVRRARKEYGLEVYTRRQWGSKKLSTYQWRRYNRPHSLLPWKPVDTIWQHISVTRDDGTTILNFFADMQELERIGDERFGSGVSYNWAVDMSTGQIGLGQSLDAAGTHTLNDKGIPGFSHNQNYVALAIVFIGMPGQRPSKKAIRSAGLLIRCHFEEGAANIGSDYVPHSLVAAKECPTEAVREVMPEIQEIATK